MIPFLTALRERVLVCDGAMGTMLYAKGVFVNRCFDALNLTDPERVLEVHREYVEAGADVIETNTFGANRLKLRRFGLADQLADINRVGAELASRAANGRTYVAGAIGPLGIRIEPWGRTGVDEAEGYFREQAQALSDGGVHLFILETFRDVNEIGAAIAAVRAVSSAPIVAQMTTGEDGSSLDGTPPEQFAKALAELGPDVIGINCSIGPAPMLDTLERIGALAGRPLSAQPNAGRPRDIDGRNIYLTSPEYMASYARRFVASGVRLVGGCCGTTPEHIRQIRTAVSAPAQHVHVAARAASVTLASSLPPTVAATPTRSALAGALDAGRRVLLAQVAVPAGHDVAGAVAHTRTLTGLGVDAVLVANGLRGSRMNAVALASLLAQHVGVDVVLQFAARGRTLLGMESDLLGAHALGIRNLVLVTGDVNPVGDYTDPGSALEVDSIGLTNAVHRLNDGFDIGGSGIGAPTAFHIGVEVNTSASDVEAQLRRLDYKVSAGADFLVTTPVFDVDAFERLLPRLEAFGLPIVATVLPLESTEQAQFLVNEVPESGVTNTVIERLQRATEDARGEGVSLAHEIATRLRPRVRGLHIAAPGDRVLSVLDVLTRLVG